MNFQDKIILVTGGTSGIDKEIVRQLLMQGAVVISNYGQNEELMKQTKTELSEYKDKLVFMKADVSNEEEVIKMFDQIKLRFHKLDCLVNNAGTNIDSYIENFNLEDWNKVINVNLTGKFLCTKYAIPLLKSNESSSIVNIASRLATKPCAEASAYCVAEAGIVQFTKCSAIELVNYKIRVNCVSPGLTITPMSLKGWTKEEMEETKQKNPMKRLGQTTDMANAVLFLLSDEASYITGENINVSGGALL